MDGGYKKLKVYRLAHELAVKVHKMTLVLPRLEMFEEGSQIRRSSKSVCAQIVEGFALRKYKSEYLHFLWRAYGSCQETVEHLELLRETGSLTDSALYDELMAGYSALNRMLFGFIESVDAQHETNLFVREDEAIYEV